MVKKSTTSKTAKAGAKTPAKAKTNSPANVLVKELVTEASIKATFEKEKAPKKEEAQKTEKPKKEYYSNKVTIINTTQSEILLNGGSVEMTVRIAPKEMKQIDRGFFRELMKIQVVKNWFDKGILASTADANETTLHEAEVPENLKGPVERTDAVSTVAASVTKFEQDGTVKIDL